MTSSHDCERPVATDVKGIYMSYEVHDGVIMAILCFFFFISRLMILWNIHVWNLVPRSFGNCAKDIQSFEGVEETMRSRPAEPNQHHNNSNAYVTIKLRHRPALDIL